MEHVIYDEENYEKKLLKDREALLSTKKPIVLFGTMTLGRIAKKTLDFLNIKIACFCDNNKEKQRQKIEGIKVLSPKEVKEKFLDAKIYICSFNKKSFEAIKNQLISLGFEDIQGTDIIQYVYQIEVIKRPVDIKQYFKTLYKLSYTDGHLTLPPLAISLTTKCTLRCKKCCALMPYFKKPSLFDKEIIIKSMKVLAQSVDAIEAFNIIGGEPLLHPELGEICNEVAKLNNVREISIITNGTITPKSSVFESVKNSVSYIQVSNYTELSRATDKLERISKENNILLDIKDKSIKWIDSGDLKPRNRNDKENRRIFKNCSRIQICHVIINGELHFCDRSGFGTALGSIPKSEDDFVNLLDDNISTFEMNKKIKNFIEHTQVITACDYCDCHLNKEIEPAVQLED